MAVQEACLYLPTPRTFYSSEFFISRYAKAEELEQKFEGVFASGQFGLKLQEDEGRITAEIWDVCGDFRIDTLWGTDQNYWGNLCEVDLEKVNYQNGEWRFGYMSYSRESTEGQAISAILLATARMYEKWFNEEDKGNLTDFRTWRRQQYGSGKKEFIVTPCISPFPDLIRN